MVGASTLPDHGYGQAARGKAHTSNRKKVDTPSGREADRSARPEGGDAPGARQTDPQSFAIGAVRCGRNRNCNASHRETLRPNSCSHRTCSRCTRICSHGMVLRGCNFCYNLLSADLRAADQDEVRVGRAWHHVGKTLQTCLAGLRRPRLAYRLGHILDYCRRIAPFADRLA